MGGNGGEKDCREFELIRRQFIESNKIAKIYLRLYLFLGFLNIK